MDTGRGQANKYHHQQYHKAITTQTISDATIIYEQIIKSMVEFTTTKIFQQLWSPKTNTHTTGIPSRNKHIYIHWAVGTKKLNSRQPCHPLTSRERKTSKSNQKLIHSDIKRDTTIKNTALFPTIDDVENFIENSTARTFNEYTEINREAIFKSVKIPEEIWNEYDAHPNLGLLLSNANVEYYY